VVAVALAAATAGFWLGWGLRAGARPAVVPVVPGAVEGPPIDRVTARDLEALRAAVETLRTEVESLRGAAVDGAALYVAGERERFRAALRRQLAQAVAWRAGLPEDKRQVADRAVQTLDAFQAQLTKVTDADALADWFDRYIKNRQKWPPQHAWLLGDLTWR
jgi:nitrate reductase beta subunit